jgi:preprotein translocase subunit SecF
MSRLGNVGSRLYRGDVSIEFVARKKLWFMISGLILVISIAALAINGLNFSVDFKGGSVFQFTAPGATSTQIASVVQNAGGGDDPIVQQLGALNAGKWQVQTTKLSYGTTIKIQDALASNLHGTGGSSKIATSFVGPSWGTQISDKAFQALIAFLIVIVIYLSIAFEWKMAVAAFVALAHDIVIAVGIYALAHFQVSPATVIGLLTILGYSLYDTVVVFDKVRENTAGLLGTGKSTYSQAANLALNQTLVRSINTSLIALLPVTAILVVGWGVLGTGELEDLGLVLFVGMLSGTYSSIFIATPVVSWLKERERQYKELARRVARREAGGRAAVRAQAKAEKAQKAAAVAGRGGSGSSATRGLGTGAETLDDDSAALDQAPGTTRRPDTPARPGASSVAASPPGPAGEDLDEATADDGADSDAGPDERVPAARAAGGGSVPRGAPGARPGPRQQPRRAGSGKRRPAGKKKRR